MNLRWLFGNFTDPQYRLSRREQFRLSNFAHQKYLTTKAFALRTLMIIAPFMAMFAVLKPLLSRFGYGMDTRMFVIIIAAACAVFWPWSAWMYRGLYLRPIRRAMREAGYDLCLGCGYELRGLPPDTVRCPECGEARQARQAPSDLK